MKLNIVIGFDICRVLVKTDDAEKKKEYAKTKLSYPSRLVIEKEVSGYETF